MDAGSIIAAAAFGVAGGVTGGLLGVGGGILFVPALVLFLGLSQLAGEATSLLAIVPVAILGAWRQHGYGNVRRMQKEDYGNRTIASDLTNPDFVKMAESFAVCARILARRKPDIVLGMGGYVTVPGGLAAKARGARPISAASLACLSSKRCRWPSRPIWPWRLNMKMPPTC